MIKKKIQKIKKYIYKTKGFFRYISFNLNNFIIKKYKKKYIKIIKKVYFFNFKKKVSNSLVLKKTFSKKIDIRVSHNNFFCTLFDLKQSKTMHTGSSGTYKIQISRRKFKKFYKTFLVIFFLKIQKYCSEFNNTIFNVTAPVKIRKNICKIIINNIKKARRLKKSKIKKQNILLYFKPKKCFNGCRAKKKIRKKRRLYRIYK